VQPHLTNRAAATVVQRSGHTDGNSGEEDSMEQLRFEERDRVQVFSWVSGVRLHGTTGTGVEVHLDRDQVARYRVLLDAPGSLSPVHDFLPADLLKVGHLFDPLLDAADEGSQP
jgi:predicted metal-dependent enzyme (double-stranded beta helix superfamily)